ncbi:MAG: ABC transporter ATP-binding protein, partial [Candidatus Desulfacyla sp.]
MFGDYGYAEEGKLGKPYNWRILKRLAWYALPYRKTIAAGLFLAILIALFDLTVPYLTKIVIDRYIVASWHRIDLDRPDDPVCQELKERYGRLLEPDRSRTGYYISNLHVKQIDPADLHLLRSRGILSTDRFYRIGPDVETGDIPEAARRDAIDMADGASLIPYSALKGLPEKEILKIRSGDIHGVTMIALVFFLLILLSLGAGYAEYYLLEFTGQRMMQDIRLGLFDIMQSQSVRFFDRHPAGRLVTRATNDIENLNEMFKSVFVTVFKDLFIVMGILVILVTLNWRLALICFALLPIIFCVTLIFSSMVREAFRELRATVAKINAFLQERIRG